MKCIPDSEIEAFEKKFEKYLDEAWGEEFGVTSIESLIEVLEEHKQILTFFSEARRVQERAKEEHISRLTFHVFCDRTDDFLKDPAEALELYMQHRSEGEPNVRLWYELGDDCAEILDPDEGYEENHMIGFGGYPN